MFSRILLPVVVAALALSTPSKAQINIHPWFQCSLDGNAYMIPNNMVMPALEAGYTCGILDIDERSSLGRACYLQWQFPRVNWLRFNPAPSAPTDYMPLNCASLEAGAGGTAPSGGATTPGGGSAGGALGPIGGSSGASGSGGSGSGGGSASVTVPVYGVWRWHASCPSGQYAGHLSFNRNENNLSNGGSFSAGEGAMADMFHSGNAVQFTRVIPGGDIHQYWSGSLVSDTRIIGAFTQNPPHLENCDFELNRK